MDSNDLTYVETYFAESVAVLQAAEGDTQLKRAIVDISDEIVKSLRGGGKVLFAGNGGSAADAQHIAGEFVSRLNFDRSPLPGLALTTDTSVLTAIGNDYGYADVFSRQVGGLGRKGDVFVAISTSGNSPNILKAVDVARAMGVVSVGFTGASGGKLSSACDLCLRVPSKSTPLIQQVHIVSAHLICGLVENAMFSKEAAKHNGVCA
ncbi:MAG: D-sedoheptulose 7-phosphate isomerase [Alphaproteobacteria bacterium]|nr:D-sedoheptulose 7-phosphate isomerase [Alphaproteobacteria bacterium]MBM3653921.1 D-sedoheptulose 7-phosphate isomerase [Alphaproteobacteria bacterium]